jgi:hypothetical protein
MEHLEPRLALSVTVAAADGVLHITGDDAAQKVTIFDAHRGLDTSATVSVDATNNGTVSDPGDLDRVTFPNITTFDIHLAGGDDVVQFQLADNYTGTTKSINVDLGEGNNEFDFISSLGEQIIDSTLTMNITAGSGTDRATLALNNIRSSQLNAALNMGAGNDRVSVFADGDIATSTATVQANLGAGRDRFDANIDLENFDILGAQSALHVTANGGAGNDKLALRAQRTGSPATNEGLFDASLNAGRGNDTLTPDLTSSDFTGPGTTRVQANGGLGTDKLTTPASAPGLSTSSIEQTLA